LNLKPDEFWKLTFAEFKSMVDGYRRRQTNKTNELIILAHNTASLTRCKNMPELKSLLIDVDKEIKPKKEQSIKSMINALYNWNIALGGEFIEEGE
jgi:hypothetical protein